MIELRLEVLETVSGGWGSFTVKNYTNNSTIVLKNFGVKMVSGAGNSGLGITLIQTINA